MATPKSNETPTFFTRNYLTLIVILVVLICAAIGLSFAYAAPSLDAYQKWFLVIGLFLFPLFSISLVAWLILRHSNKLVVGQNVNSIEWETSSAEKQKRKLNTEVRALAKHLSIPNEQLSDLRSAYIVAEDLALRKIQSEANTPLMHKISIGNSDFDAICIDKDLITCVEVAFVVTEDIVQDKISSYLRKTVAAKTLVAKSRKGSRFRLLLVFVTQLDEQALIKLRANIKSKFTAETTPIAVDIRFLDFLTLQKIYAED